MPRIPRKLVHVSVRISEDDYNEIIKLINNYEYESVSEAIRALIRKSLHASKRA